MDRRMDTVLEMPTEVAVVEEPVPTSPKEHPFLEGLTPHQHRLLSDCAMQAHFEPGTMLFREGDPANSFYMIQSGKIALECHNSATGITHLQTLGGGDVLGWSWLFPPYFWHFGARVLEPTDALCVRTSILRDECDADHELGYELTKRLALVVLKRLQATRRQLVEMRAKST